MLKKYGIPILIIALVVSLSITSYLLGEKNAKQKEVKAEVETFVPLTDAEIRQNSEDAMDKALQKFIDGNETVNVRVIP